MIIFSIKCKKLQNRSTINISIVKKIMVNQIFAFCIRFKFKKVYENFKHLKMRT